MARLTVALLLVLAMSVKARADCSGYPGVPWGTSLEDLHGLYRGGVDHKDAKGRTIYRVEREIDGRSAVLSFTVRPIGGVSYVIVHFPKGDVDLVGGHYAYETNPAAIATFASEKEKLVQRYGRPMSTEEDPPVARWWCHGMVELGVEKGDLPHRWVVALTYKMPPYPPTLRGAAGVAH
jgi:hypothetical protein